MDTPPPTPNHTGQTPAIMELEYIKVFYILIDSEKMPFGEPCLAYIGHDELVHHLKENVMERHKEMLTHVIVAEMEVWRCQTLTLQNADPDKIDELIGGLKFSYDEDNNCKRVGMWVPMRDLELKEYEPLIVRVPQKAKRKREDDYREGARRSKLAHIRPSKLNSASIYEALQESQQDRILDDCPKPDSDLPPLPLIYRGFGEFHDFINNSAANYPNAFSKEAEVDELVDAMCHLGYEEDKRTRIQDLLRHIFAGPERNFEYSVDNRTQASTDGHVTASHGGPLLILGFEREIAVAEGQMASYFLRLALNSTSDVFYGWRQPALGVIISGTIISFVGLVMIDSQVRVLPLTHPFISNDSEIPNRMRLYATFEASCRLLDRIEQDAARLVISPPRSISGSHRRHPDIHNLLRVSGKGQVGDRLNFKITRRLETGLEGKRLLYLATTTDRDQKVILLKFSRTYSKELHEFCASIKHAPELLGFERLPGGWFGVAMEYFPSADRIHESKGLCDYGDKWLKDIENVVKKFHAQGYVHGDLRPPNFIVNGDRLFLIDFDWGGKEGKAAFPRRRLHPILREARWDTLITKYDDKRVMEFTKGHIRVAIKHAHI